MSSPQQSFYEFGPFHLDPLRPRLTRAGELVPLTPKALELLLTLIQQGGKVVEKDELMQRVWPDTFVEESNLSVHVFALRKALGETTEGQSYIETVPRQGYRFTAKVRDVGRSGAELVVERRTLSRVTIEERDVRPEVGTDEADQILPRASSSPTLLTVARPALRRFATRGQKWRLALISMVTVLAVVLGLLLYAQQSRGRKRPATSPAIKSIAVLPLKPLGPDGQTENYLGVGLADALITRLGGLDELSVRPTSAILRFDGPRQDSLTAARALGVDAILEGSYQHEGRRVRVSVQLVGSKDGTQLWASSFEDEFNNIFAMQDAISAEVAEALIENLNQAEHRLLTRHPTVSVEAYHEYLKGRFFWNKRTTEGLRKAVEHFNLALDLDPLFAQAHAGLADTHALLCNYGERPAECFTQAKESALKAIKLDPTLAEPHTSLAFVLYRFDRNWAEAEGEFRKAIELNPNYATAHHWYGEYLGIVGRHPESIEEFEQARRLDPFSLIINTDVGAGLYKARQYDAAIEQLRKTVEMDRHFSVSHLFLGMSYKQKGMYAEAIAELQEAVRLSGRRTIMIAVLGNIYGTSGEKAEALRALKELAEVAEKHYVPAFHIALIHVGLGNKDEAFKWLEKSYENHDTLFAYLKVDPNLDPLRTDPRFSDLMNRAGFAPSK